MQRATFAVYRLGRYVVFAPDFAEYACEQDRKHDADLQVNGIADFVMLPPDFEIESPSSDDCRHRRSDRDQQDDQESCGVAHDQVDSVAPLRNNRSGWKSGAPCLRKLYGFSCLA